MMDPFGIERTRLEREAMRRRDVLSAQRPVVRTRSRLSLRGRAHRAR
jgi:hypothetical protein